MKTRILPVVIGAVLAGGMNVAQADVQVFGHIDTSIDAIDVDGGADDINLHCTTCSVGFKGSEDLGNGLKAIFMIDFQYDTINRNSNGSITDRDQWLGLKGNFGQVRVGTISTGYKSHGAMLDPLYRTALEGRAHGLQSSFHTGAGEELRGRADNTIRYDSPSFNGLKAVAHYTLDSDETDGEDEDPYGIGASYENGGILVFADYLDNNQSGTAEDTVWKVGGKYSLNSLAIMAQYEDWDDGDSADYDIWHVGASFTMGNNMLYFAFGQEDNEGTDTDAWTLAAMHSLSKRTKAYVGFNQEDEEGSGETDQFSLGLKHKF